MTKRTLYIVLAILGLVSVRLVGRHLFYDPLIPFFHQADYMLKPLPDLVYWKYFTFLFLRFIINSAFTLIIVKELFGKPDLIRLTAFILGLTFLVLAPILMLLIWNGESSNYQYLFYARRILIHPVLTLILIPAYLYHQRSIKRNSND